ncbi:MAG: alpha/beta fold hydrolase [Gammaproteobacteria bacterium]|nr:alpha/beta fold hydrolase [Gammaproteobacteria bacterium]
MSRVDLAALDAGLAAHAAEVLAALPVLMAAAPPEPAGVERVLLAERDQARLWHYPCDQPRGAVFMIYAFVNRPSMLDLDPRHSLIRRLGELGIAAFLVEWTEPAPERPELDLEACLDRVLPELLVKACTESGREALPVLGVCQGGALSLMLASRQPERVAGLICLVTPVDFQTEDDALSRFAQELDLTALAGQWRSLPAALLDHLFLLLKPYELRIRKYAQAHRLAQDPEALAEFLRMEQWIFGGPRLAAGLLRDFVAGCYQGNGLVSGAMADLSALSMPVLNVYALADHLVPPAASRALGGLLPAGGDHEEAAFPGGHIGIFVSLRAQGLLARRIADWLSLRGL